MLDRIKQSGLFRGIDNIDPNIFVCSTHGEGEYLCRKGEQGNCLWIIIEGRVAAKIDDLTIAVRGPSEIVGEQAILMTAGIRTADLQVVEGEAKVAAVSISQIQRLPYISDIYHNLAQLLSWKLSQATSQRTEYKLASEERRRMLLRFVGQHALSHQMLAPEDWQGEGYYARQEFILWFSDIVGFSRFSNIAPNELAIHVQRFLTPQVATICSSGGYVDKLMGDGIMAYWSCDTLGSESASKQAVETAIKVVSAIRNLHIDEHRLNIRIGLHLGTAAVGNYGTPERSQFTLIGGEVNKAARFEQIKGEDLGPIRLSAELYAKLPHDLRDKCQPFTSRIVKPGESAIDGFTMFLKDQEEKEK